MSVVRGVLCRNLSRAAGATTRGHGISALDNAEFAEANSRATVVTLCVVAAISGAVAFAVVCC
jgi:hypothetical protein